MIVKWPYRYLLAFLLFFWGLYISRCENGGGEGAIETPPLVTENKLNVEILDAAIGPDRRPVVTFRLMDDRGNPISRNGVNLRFYYCKN